MFETSARMGGIWGWRGVIGYIEPTVFGAVAKDLFQLAPDGVGLLVATLGINRVSDENLAEALTHVDTAARQLAEGGAHFILLSGPFGMLTREGIDPSRELVKRLEEASHLPSTTLFLATVDALKALSVKKLIWFHPGSPVKDYESRAKKMWENYGFEMVNIKSAEVEKLGLRTNRDVRKLPMNVLYNMVREAYLEAPEADGVYISCGAWGGAPVIECLEQDFGKPFLQVTSVLLWAGLKALKVRAPVKGFGRLFETLYDVGCQ